VIVFSSIAGLGLDFGRLVKKRKDIIEMMRNAMANLQLLAFESCVCAAGRGDFWYVALWHKHLALVQSAISLIDAEKDAKVRRQIEKCPSLMKKKSSLTLFTACGHSTIELG
jgi:hypothetical protein